MGINIELKATNLDISLAKVVVRELKEHWSLHFPPPLISSLSSTCLHTMYKEGDNYFLGVVFDIWLGGYWKSLLGIHHCIFAHLNYKQLEQLAPQRIKAIKDTFYYLLCYTVNDIQLTNRFFFLWN